MDFELRMFFEKHAGMCVCVCVCACACACVRVRIPLGFLFEELNDGSLILE